MITVTARNANGAELTVKATTTFKTVKAAVTALPGIKSGINPQGKRNRVASYDVTSKSGTVTTYTRDANGVPVKVKAAKSSRSPKVTKSAVETTEAVEPTENVAESVVQSVVPAKPAKTKRPLKTQVDVYKNGAGKSVTVTISVDENGKRTYSIRTISPAVLGKKNKKGKRKIVKAQSDMTRNVTRAELTGVIVPYIDGMGLTLTDRTLIPA